TRSACHSFFVSEELQSRAISEYDLAHDCTSVSMNATTTSFLRPAAPAEIAYLLSKHPQLKQPIIGVVGGVNVRLDFGLLVKVAALSDVGSLVFIGPISARIKDSDFTQLRVHSHCFWLGEQPHESLGLW